MPDLKTVLTETLDQHIGYLYGDTTATSATDGQVGGCTGCDWRGGGADHTAHLADVLLSLPGVAVTQLPEPSHAGTVSTSFRHVTYWHSVHQVRGEKRLITVDDPGRCMSADEARVLAADLLAAAAALSVEGNTNA